MPVAGLTKGLGKGKYKLYSAEISGPTSYTTGGFTVTASGISKIHNAAVVLKNNPGNKLIRFSISGNSITIQIFTIAADTTTGAISATEDAAGTDESSLLFEIILVGE